MGQLLHGSAKTTHAVRAAIQRSKASIEVLSERYDLNPKTVMKWKKGDFVHDAPMGPTHVLAGFSVCVALPFPGDAVFAVVVPVASLNW
jgi:hypothetical protein